MNVPVADNDVKKSVMASMELAQAIQAVEEKLAETGRVLVRPSGTEALMRVMVEAQTEDAARSAAEELASLIRKMA